MATLEPTSEWSGPDRPEMLGRSQLLMIRPTGGAQARSVERLLYRQRSCGLVAVIGMRDQTRAEPINYHTRYSQSAALADLVAAVGRQITSSPPRSPAPWARCSQRA